MRPSRPDGSNLRIWELLSVLHEVLRAIVANPSDAEDITQQTFMSAWTGLMTRWSETLCTPTTV